MPAEFLERITIKGFKSIASIEDFELRPINVLIGANGSGKSNFVASFSLLQTFMEGGLDRFVALAGGADRLLHFGSKKTTSIVYEAWLRDGLGYGVSLEAGDGDKLVGLNQFLSDRGKKLFSWKPTRAHRLYQSFSQQLVQWRVYHLHDTSTSSPMRKTAKVDDNRFLRPDGSNLASFLYYLKKRQPGSYDLICKTVQRVAPFFLDFNLKPVEIAAENIILEWKHRNSDQYFGVSALSDGTLRFIALATLFLQPKDNRPSLILVDEPELGLHPYAIGLLAAMIQQASVDTQVIVSTQSSLLLDHFQPEDVIVADCIDGATQLSRLDGERLAKWLEDYSLGQLWEKNEIGGLPGSI